MKKFYEDAEVTVTKFEYENIMVDVVSGEGIPDTEGPEIGGDGGDGGEDLWP